MIRLLLPPTYLLKPALGAAGFVKILLLPETMVSAVLLLSLNIKFTCVDVDALIWDDADVNDLATNIKLPEPSVKVTVFPEASVRVWSPVNTLLPVVAND